MIQLRTLEAAEQLAREVHAEQVAFVEPLLMEQALLKTQEEELTAQMVACATSPSGTSLVALRKRADKIMAQMSIVQAALAVVHMKLRVYGHSFPALHVERANVVLNTALAVLAPSSTVP